MLERTRAKVIDGKLSPNGVHMPALRGRRVLVCEDEPLIALFLETAIEEADGVLAGSARSVEDGLRCVAAGGIHAAILDFNLVDGPVTPVLEALVARHVPVVILTGGGVPADIQIRFPQVEIRTKPMRPRDILHLVAVRLFGAE